jgi:hypothetical protein
MPDREKPAELSGPMEVATYVAAISVDLAAMARRNGLDTIGYLLEMVHLEAESTIRHMGPR